MALKTLVLLALLATAPGDADEPAETAAEAAGRAYTNGLLADIRASGSPRERALFARLGGEPARTDEILRVAAQEAPTDPLVQMFWSTLGKDPQAWSRLQPGNGFAWLPALEAEAATLDDAGIDAALARIAEAQAYDDHFVETWLAFRKAIGARPVPPAMAKFTNGDTAVARDVMAMAHAAALPIPLLALSRACQRWRHPQASAARFASCAKIGRGIAQSNVSAFSKRIGFALVRSSGSEQAADREARRALDWLLHASIGLIDDNDGVKPEEAAGYFADLASTASETRTLELLLARHGISIYPPADWQQAP